MNFGLILKILGKVIVVYKLKHQNHHLILFDCIINTLPILKTFTIFEGGFNPL